MTTLPLALGSYVRLRAAESPWQLKNLYFEKNPANQAEQVALIERPALVSYLSAGTGPGRRLYRQPGFSSGDLFHVSANDLWKHHMNVNRTVTSTQITGTIAGTGRPDIAADYTHLFITDGTTLQYTNGTAALATIATPDGIPMISLDIFNGYVICVQNNSDRFYWILPGVVTIDPLNFATAERLPDAVSQVRTIGDEIWFFGYKSIEPWRATGDATAPFQRTDGRSFAHGIFDGTAVPMKSTSIIAVSDEGTVYELAGTEQPISDPSIAERTRNAILTALGG